MIRQRTAPVIIALFTFAVACTAAAGASKKPRVYEYEAGHEFRPASFDALWDSAVAVVHGRVVSTKVQLSTATSTPLPVTEVHLLVDEALKGNLPLDPSRTLTVCQIAGEFENEDVIVRQLGVEPLSPGREYVLFLGWNPALGRWMVRGSNGAFELTEGRVRPLGKAPAVDGRKSQGAAAFIDELRLRARSGGAGR